MKCLFSIAFVFKLSIRVVTLSSLYSKLRFSPVSTVSFRSLRELSKYFNWQQNAKEYMKEQYWFYVCLFVKDKLNDTISINLF